ncbi:MAG: ATP-dependent RNA helicase HrpA [Syntrophobacterales bacterium]|nr:ATP-dependent RNA helicase HrpA [Syntrophobacterales bacterium]
MPHKSRLIPTSIPYPPDLPIVAKRDEIISQISRHKVLVVAGTTGSGKSTQIPKMCLEAGKGRRGLIGCTQPRRIAAIALARQVSRELGPSWQHLVGYKVRFNDTTGPHTIIKFLTDGMLLAEAQNDRLFSAYEVIMIDEAHERSLNIDLLIGMLQQVVVERDDLTVIISSATIDPQKFSNTFSQTLGMEVPIVEIPSKLYPVEVIYRPWNIIGESDEWSYVDQAIEIVEELLMEGKGRLFQGDILVFMPTERDIRETVQRLGERDLAGAKVYPLYARQAPWEQEKIFESTSYRKIIVATNVAETSLTIPNVSCVIDTGLARISHYSPRTGIKSLPILPISRASADQRKGRCGRTGPGICIRLYSEEDYANRQEFTPPEVKRANLAEVILRMLALGLGDVESFPFLDPPHKTAIREGFFTLKQLGAIDDKGELTAIGRTMARFPLDPRLSRIIIEARRRKALKEVFIIVSALNVQDPRKRPFGEEEIADRAHAVFSDPRSDFLSLLNIWKAFHREAESGLSKTKQKEWCRRHYLSYRIIREWINIYEELLEILEELEDTYLEKIFRHHPIVNPLPQQKPEEVPPDYEAIHCSLLSGFLCTSGGVIAMHEGRGRYRGGRDKELFIFPGSFVKKNPPWIMAAEVVETSRVFARYVAEIEPQWVEEVGQHLCHYSYRDPHWDSKGGTVVAFERVTYQGLPIIENRPVSYGKINPKEAREIFIMEALVDGKLGRTYPFMVHNEKVIQEIRNIEEKIRRRGLVADREALFRFYDGKIPEGISDIRSFDKFLRGSAKEGGQRLERYPMDKSLRITVEDILEEILSDDLDHLFPGHINILGTEFSLTYRFSPGSEDDGITITVPLSSIEIIGRAYREGILGWIVPGYLEEKIFHILKGLPKAIRRTFMPIHDTVKELLREIWPSRILPEKSFWIALSEALKILRGIEITAGELAGIDIPKHLVFRIEIVDSTGKVRAGGREVIELLEVVPRDYEDERWEEAKKRFEIRGLKEFPEDPLPDRIEIINEPSVGTIYAYPGLVDQGKDGGVSVKLFRSPSEAQGETSKGLLRLYEEALRPVIGKYASSWIIPPRLHQAAFFMFSKEGMPALNEKLRRFIISDIFSIPPRVPVSEVVWDKVREKIEFAKKHLFTLGRERLETVLFLIEKREVLRKKINKYLDRSLRSPSAMTVKERMDVMLKELDDIVPPDFLSRYSLSEVKMAIGFLHCLEERVDRCYSSPEKDKVKERLVIPYIQRYNRIEQYIDTHPEDMEMQEIARNFKWLLIGHKALIFTPEALQRRFGTGVTRNYSAKALEETWKECEKIRHGL